MVLRIRIIWAKTCPICKRILKDIILPLQEMLYDKIVVEFKETSPISGFEGATPMLSGGMYKTAFGKTPEIYVEDRIYVIPHYDHTAMYKFLKELLEKLKIYEETLDMTVYRKRYIIKRVDSMVKKLKRLIEEEEKKI